MFVAHIKELGEGCDYTIGCGQILIRLKSKTTDEAINELKKKVVGEDAYWGGQEFESIILLDVVKEVQIPINKWYSEEQENAVLSENKAKELAEKKEFERLKAKFGV